MGNLQVTFPLLTVIQKQFGRNMGQVGFFFFFEEYHAKHTNLEVI